MPPIVIEDNEFATLWYHPDKKIIHHQFHKFFSGERFRAFMLKGSEALRKYKVRKWLSDDRDNPVLTNDDLAWGDKNWFAPTIQAGWKYWAIVKPKFALAQFTMEELVVKFAKDGIVAQFFDNPDEAMKWLEKQP